MRIIKMSDLGDDIIDEIISGSVFIYPTDTIYGIGCNALIEDSVKKIYTIKKRPGSMPLSIIAPTHGWISKNCIADMDIVKKYLPGPFTLILRKKDTTFLDTVSAGSGTIGVRIITHPFMKYLRKAGVPFVTTSVNVSGKEPIYDISTLPGDIKSQVDIIIEAGTIRGKPSKIIDLSSDERRIIRQ